MSRPNAARTRAVDAAAHRLVNSGALDGWLSTPASTASVSRPSSSATSSRRGSSILASSRPPTQPLPPSRSQNPSSSTRDPEKSPSAFYEHGEFHGVREPPEEIGAHASSSSAPAPAPTRRPAAQSAPSPLQVPPAPEGFRSAPAYGDRREDYADPTIAPAPSLRPQRSRIGLFRRSSSPPPLPETISHALLAMRIQRLPEMLNKPSISLRGAKLRPFDVDQPRGLTERCKSDSYSRPAILYAVADLPSGCVDVDAGGVERTRPSQSGIQEVIARGDGIWINISRTMLDGGQGQVMALHTLPDRVALDSRRLDNKGDPRTLKVVIHQLKDTLGNRPFKDFPHDEWTFVSRVGCHRRSPQLDEFPATTREIQTNWILRGAGLPAHGIMVAFVFRTPFEPHSRPGANDRVEVSQFELGKRRAPRVYKERSGYRRWSARDIEM